MNSICAFAEIFGNDIANIINDKSIVAGATNQRVGTCPAIKRIITSQAIQSVTSGITGANKIVQRIPGASSSPGIVTTC